MIKQAVIGAGGLLGAGFARAVRRDANVDFVPLPGVIPWDNTTDAQRVLNQIVTQFVAGAAGEPWRLVWAAGTGRVGDSASVMAQQSAAFTAVCETLASLDRRNQRLGQVVFASSAGAIYAGHGHGVIGTTTRPSPLSDYGHHKLAQENQLAALGNESDLSIVICRYSNLFGVRANATLGGGLVTAAIRSGLTRTPLQLYVSPDSRRDYLYNRDAAEQTLDIAGSAERGVTTHIVCAGQTRTVADVVETVGRVLGRRVPVLYGSTPETQLQPLELRFENEQAPRRPSTLFPAAVAATVSDHRPH